MNEGEGDYCLHYFEVLFWCRHGINMHHTLRIATLERDKITNILIREIEIVFSFIVLLLCH